MPNLDLPHTTLDHPAGQECTRCIVYPGYVECACCGITVIGYPGARCNACLVACGAGPVATEGNWHCFTGHCDGSGCTYPGECESDDPDSEPDDDAHQDAREAAHDDAHQAERDAYWYHSA